MAAMRSALAMVSRRCCRSSGSQAAAFVSGRGMELYQVFRPPPLPLRPAAVHEGWQSFSTESMKWGGQDKQLFMKGKAKSILRMWWQRSRGSVKNVIKGDRSMSILLYIGYAAYLCFLASLFRSAHLRAFGSSTDTRTEPVHSCVGTHTMPVTYFMIPAFRVMGICTRR